MAVTPRQGTVVIITVGGTAVQVMPPGVNGGYIVNPSSDADQGVTAENLYVDPTEPPGLTGNGTTSIIAPGYSFAAIPNSSLGLWVNGATTGHKFTVVYW